MGNQSSYSVRIITEWLDEQKIEWKHASPNLDRGMTMTQTGLSINLNTHIRMSIQTDPRVAGPSFAETAIQANGGVIYSDELGYSDVIRHDEPSELFQHIKDIMETIKSKGENFGSDMFPEKRHKRKTDDSDDENAEKPDNEKPNDCPVDVQQSSEKENCVNENADNIT